MKTVKINRMYLMIRIGGIIKVKAVVNGIAVEVVTVATEKRGEEACRKKRIC